MSAEKSLASFFVFYLEKKNTLGPRLERHGCDYDLRTIDNLVQLFSSLKAM